MRIHAIEIENFAATRGRIAHHIGPGRQRITGPSEAGKTRGTVGALALALWGCDEQGGPADTALIHEGEQVAEVALYLHTPDMAPSTSMHPATSLRARITRSGAATWQVMGKRCSSKATLAAALGPVGAHRDLGLAIVSPFWWRTLQAEKKGRPLRDLLLSLLPPGDLAGTVAGMMGEFWDPKLPLDMKLAMDLQKSRNAAELQAEGAARQARQTAQASEAALAAGEPREPGEAEIRAHMGPMGDLWKPEKVEAATKYLAKWQEYQAHQSSQVEAERARIAYGHAEANLRAWQEKSAEIERRVGGLQPARPIAEIRKDIGIRRTEVNGYAAKRRDLPPELRDLQRRVVELEVVAKAPSLCPHCNKPTDARFESIEAIAEQLETARSKAQAEAHSWDSRWKVRIDEAEKEIALLEAQAEHSRTHAAAVEARMILGPRPELPLEVPPAPASWQGPELREDYAKRAKQTLEASQSAEVSKRILLAEHAVRADRYHQAAGRAEADRRAAEGAESAHREAAQAAHQARQLVEALRRAPSEVARAGQEKLAARLDKGGIGLQWGSPDTSGPEIALSIDGRPWHAASTGRQIQADAWFRSTLRAMAVSRIPVPEDAPIRWQDLPIVVDSAGLCTRPWWPSPELALWLLYTQPGAQEVVIKPWPPGAP